MESDHVGPTPAGTAFTRRIALRGSLWLAATLGLGTRRASAQDSTPPPSEPVTLVAHRLTNPRGFTWDSNGDLYVAIYGEGRILRFNRQAQLTGTIEAPTRYLTNIAFNDTEHLRAQIAKHPLNR